jgi:hypothetical protein
VRLVTYFDTGLSRRLSAWGYLARSRAVTIPYDGLAAELAARGLNLGTLVTASPLEGGNMRAYFPVLRVVSRDSRRGEPAPERPGQHRGCVLLWTENQTDPMHRWTRQELGSAVRLNVTRPTIWGTRHGVWYVLAVDPRTAICS